MKVQLPLWIIVLCVVFNAFLFIEGEFQAVKRWKPNFLYEAFENLDVYKKKAQAVQETGQRSEWETNVRYGHRLKCYLDRLLP